MLEHAIWREQRLPHVLAIYDGSSKILSVCNIHIKQKKIQKVAKHKSYMHKQKRIKHLKILHEVYRALWYKEC